MTTARNSAARIRADVTHLASFPRDSAGPGERASAAWIAGRLREVGAADVRVEPFRYQGTYAYAHALHAVAGLAGGLVSLAALVSLEREASGRGQWLRRLLPGTEGANVVGRIAPAAGTEPRATLVLLAHHDAARTGAIWHPRIQRAGAERNARRRRIEGFMLPTALGLGLAALPQRHARLAGRALLALTVAVDLDVARSPTVPGADDNATGVAVLLALTAELARAPRPHVELVLLTPGCEESGMGGMAAFLREHAAELRARPSVLFLSLDTLGAGTPILAASEGTIREHCYRPEDLALADAGAARASDPPPPRWRIGGWTDPILARFAGFGALSLLSMGPGYIPDYHRLTDTPDRVDWTSVARCARIARGIVDAFAASAR